MPQADRESGSRAEARPPSAPLPQPQGSNDRIEPCEELGSLQDRKGRFASAANVRCDLRASCLPRSRYFSGSGKRTPRPRFSLWVASRSNSETETLVETLSSSTQRVCPTIA